MIKGPTFVHGFCALPPGPIVVSDWLSLVAPELVMGYVTPSREDRHGFLELTRPTPAFNIVRFMMDRSSFGITIPGVSLSGDGLSGQGLDRWAAVYQEVSLCPIRAWDIRDNHRAGRLMLQRLMQLTNTGQLGRSALAVLRGRDHAALTRGDDAIECCLQMTLGGLSCLSPLGNVYLVASHFWDFLGIEMKDFVQ